MIEPWIDPCTGLRYSFRVALPNHPQSMWLPQAQALPIAFAQVREDPRIDQWLVRMRAKECSRPVSVLQIASGGCTACVLAAMPEVEHLHLVDPNPAQMALSRVKLHLLQYNDESCRLRLLGHSRMPAESRRTELSAILVRCQLPDTVLGPQEILADAGPDFSGRYEMLFAELQRQLRSVGPEIETMLSLTDPQRQSALSGPGTSLGQAFDQAFTDVFCLPHLVSLFGVAATSNAVRPFAEHFLDRLRETLSHEPARTNPYLWQLLLGRYPPHLSIDWLSQPQASHLAKVTWSVATMQQTLANTDRRYDIIHLSNILDWLDPIAAQQILSMAKQALHAAGHVIVRQLNSTLDIPALGADFHWNREEGVRLLQKDRSFFYRSLHLGRLA
jgi:S-adenosylmethionine-diacylglycerol 3-amino-3-carboxypropyl transferase